MTAYAISTASMICGSRCYRNEAVQESRSDSAALVWNREPLDASTQERPRRELAKEILFLITSNPEMDDLQIAENLRQNPFIISSVLREMETAGLVEGL